MTQKFSLGSHNGDGGVIHEMTLGIYEILRMNLSISSSERKAAQQSLE
jgi:hypothetical protein